MDAHFAVAMRQVNEYVDDTTLNFSTPGDLVTALQHHGALANSTAGIFDIK